MTTAWHETCKVLQRVVRMAQYITEYITEAELPDIYELYTRQKSQKIIQPPKPQSILSATSESLEPTVPWSASTPNP